MVVPAAPTDNEDFFNLRRFVDAQEPIYATALGELSRGHKQTHWIWFVFPQVDGLGKSAMAHRYAIKSRAEADAYLAHPVLGPRLLECTETILDHPDLTAHDIFGSPDDMKFRSCLTLFELVDGGPTFSEALTGFFDGKRDPATLSIFAGWKN
jgi:uncharacterized protein (DUF1810 family)